MKRDTGGNPQVLTNTIQSNDHLKCSLVCDTYEELRNETLYLSRRDLCLFFLLSTDRVHKPKLQPETARDHGPRFHQEYEEMIDRDLWIALAPRVIVVAVTDDLPGLIAGKKGDWAAYIGVVEGVNHDQEVDEIARRGSKVPRWMAEKLFPITAKSYEWRP